MSEISSFFSCNHQLFSTITSSDFDFGIIKDSKNKEIKLNQNNFSLLFTSNDEILRKMLIMNIENCMTSLKIH